MNPGRRTLAFSSLDEIVPEAERLLSGYRSVGSWSLGQICRHLANSFRYTSVTPADAEPAPPLTPEQIEGRKVLDHGRLPEGVPMRNPKSLPPEGLDDRPEIETLREAIGGFQNATGPGPVHPRLGPFTRDEWTRFHCIHAAHHLSFLIPEGEEARG